MKSSFGSSERKACTIVDLNRSTNRYQPKLKTDEGLRKRMRELAYKHKRHGSPRLHVLLRREGFVINHKRTERLYREEGLSLRKRTRKKRVASVRVQMPPSIRTHEVWSMDFCSDACANGRRFRVLTIVDDFTRVSPGILVNPSIPARKVTEFIDQVALSHGCPERIRVDNGPEFTSRTFQQWAERRDIHIEYIRPGKPTDNAFIEIFNGKFRDECLNEHWFVTFRPCTGNN